MQIKKVEKEIMAKKKKNLEETDCLVQTDFKLEELDFDFDEDIFIENPYPELEDVACDEESEKEKLGEKRSRQWLTLFAKLRVAEKKNDAKAIEKAKEALRKHDTQDSVLKLKGKLDAWY